MQGKTFPEDNENIKEKGLFYCLCAVHVDGSSLNHKAGSYEG